MVDDAEAPRVYGYDDNGSASPVLPVLAVGGLGYYLFSQGIMEHGAPLAQRFVGDDVQSGPGGAGEFGDDESSGAEARAWNR